MPKKSTTARGGTQRNRPRTQKSFEVVRQTSSDEQEPVTDDKPEEATAPKGSAAARLAARRQGQRSQLKSSATLITAEHYSYVKRDLAIIAVLASFMFVAIIVLYFVLGRGF